MSERSKKKKVQGKCQYSYHTWVYSACYSGEIIDFGDWWAEV